MIYNDTTNKQGLYQHLKYITGQDSLSIQDATRLFNFATDRYSYIALTSSGRWKFDDTNHVDGDLDPTFPIATATLNAGESSIPLATSFLTIERVTVIENGKKKILRPIDLRDNKSTDLSAVYSDNGVPEYYDYNAHALFIYPASNTSRTIELQYGRAMKHFDTTDTSVVAGIPSIHHEYLTLYAGEQLMMRTNDQTYSAIRDARMRMEMEIRDWYSKRDQDTPRQLIPKMPQVGGSRRGRSFISRGIR